MEYSKKYSYSYSRTDFWVLVLVLEYIWNSSACTLIFSKVLVLEGWVFNSITAYKIFFNSICVRPNGNKCDLSLFIILMKKLFPKSCGNYLLRKALKLPLSHSCQHLLFRLNCANSMINYQSLLKLWILFVNIFTLYLWPYYKRKLELECNLSEILPANCKFIHYSTPT